MGYLGANFFSFDTFSTYLIFFLLVGYSLSLTKEVTLQNTETKNKVSGNWLKIKKYRTPILAVLFALLIWFVWNYNIKPFQVNTEINKAELLVQNGRCDLALEKMENALNKKTFLDAYLRLKYADILVECRKKMPQSHLELTKRGIEVVKEAIKIEPYHTSSYIVLGSLIDALMENETNPEIKEELKKEADIYFEKAKKLSPKRQEVFIEWTKSDLIAGKYQEAKEKAVQCIELNPKLGDCWWVASLSYAYLNELEKFESHRQTAAQRGYPVNSKTSWLQLSQAYIEIENYKGLVETYSALIKLEPNNAQYYASLAAVYRELGQIEKARETALKILEILPEAKGDVEMFLESLRQ